MSHSRRKEEGASTERMGGTGGQGGRLKSQLVSKVNSSQKKAEITLYPHTHPISLLPFFFPPSLHPHQNVSIDDVTLESAIERLQVKQARAERAAAKKAAKAAKTGKGSKAGAAETSTEAGKGSGKEAGKAAKAAKEGKGSKSGAAETSTEAGKGAEKEATKEASKRASKEAGKKASKSAGTDEKGELLQQEEVEGEGMGVGGAGKGGKAVRVKKGKEEEEEEGRGEMGQEFTRGTSQKEQQKKQLLRLPSLPSPPLPSPPLPSLHSHTLSLPSVFQHEQLSIFEATKLVWDYVKAHNLKTGSHTAAFDDKLRALFGVDEANSSKVPGLLLPHMQEVAEAGKEASEMGKEASEMGKEAAQVRKEAYEVGKEVAQAEEEAGKEGKAVRPLKSFEMSPKKTDLEAGEEPRKEGGKEVAQAEEEAGKEGKAAREGGEEDQEGGGTEEGERGKGKRGKGKRGKGEAAQEVKLEQEKQNMKVWASQGGVELARRNRLPRRPSEQLKEIIGKEVSAG
ncbi:unnamed protein product [Closterium sp. NIES-53]